VHREITGRDSRSAVTAAGIAQNGGAYTYQYTAGYYAQSGQAEYIEITNGGVSQQHLEYEYDVFGNLDHRSTNVSGGTTETLVYDDLQRLITSTRNYNSGAPNDVVTYTYDKSGSFTSKSDYGSLYQYHADRPHVLTQVTLTGGGTVTFSHDENGNVTQGDGETITYNAFNKPTLIKSGATEMEFQYGADLMRYRQITPSGGTIYYLDKLMEIEQVGSTIDYRHYLGEIAVLTKTGDLNDPTPSIDYLIRDRLGSVALVGDNTGLLAETRAYDAFGKPRNANWSNKNPAKLNSNITDRGFTDHEHLDTWQLIHMNGRGYDYNLGRFLSIDPIIQAPGNSQSINPYTYIFNNPKSFSESFCKLCIHMASIVFA